MALRLAYKILINCNKFLRKTNFYLFFKNCNSKSLVLFILSLDTDLLQVE